MKVGAEGRSGPRQLRPELSGRHMLVGRGGATTVHAGHIWAWNRKKRANRMRGVKLNGGAARDTTIDQLPQPEELPKVEGTNQEGSGSQQGPPNKKLKVRRGKTTELITELRCTKMRVWGGAQK